MSTSTKATKSTKPAAVKAASKAPIVAQATTPAAQPQTPAVALRGGPAVAKVRLTGKAYRSAAKHNTDWFAQITGAATQEQAAPVADLLKAGVPSHFIGYTLRRGYLVAAE